MDQAAALLPPPSTEIASRLEHSIMQEEGGGVPAGNWSPHSTKYNQREEQRYNSQSESRGCCGFYFYSSQNTEPGVPRVCPASPRAPLEWSPPRTCIQETGPDAGNRAEPPLGRKALMSEQGRGQTGVPGCCGLQSRQEGAQPPGCRGTASAGLRGGQAEVYLSPW